MAWAEDYDALTRSDAGDARLDDGTWNDLEFPEIMRRMDTTVTTVGRQVLFRWLRCMEPDEQELSRKRDFYRLVTEYPMLRTSLRKSLRGLRKRDCGHLVDYLFDAPQSNTMRRSLLDGWGIVSLLILVLAWVAALPAWLWILTLCVNLMIVVRLHWRVSRDAKVMSDCMGLMRAGDEIGALRGSYSGVCAFDRLHERRQQRNCVRHAIGFFSIMQREPLSWVVTWLNLVCVLEPIAHAHAMHSFYRLRTMVGKDFEDVGWVDAGVAVASFLQLFGNVCTPRISAAGVLELSEACHPLLPEGTANSIVLSHRSALVCGSNMAGKTTFAKMVAVNVVVAQTLGICFAKAATVPRMHVFTSIHNGHSVASGKSRYFSEVGRVRTFLVPTFCHRPRLLVVDEIFSGTNTVERIAIARAVLEELGQDSIVLATTHDVELAELLNASFDNFYFQEDPDIDGYFDYCLRPGKACQRNAIRMLHELGFPSRVVSRAATYAVPLQKESRCAEFRESGDGIASGG